MAYDLDREHMIEIDFRIKMFWWAALGWRNHVMFTTLLDIG